MALYITRSRMRLTVTVAIVHLATTLSPCSGLQLGARHAYAPMQCSGSCSSEAFVLEAKVYVARGFLTHQSLA